MFPTGYAVWISVTCNFLKHRFWNIIIFYTFRKISTSNFRIESIVLFRIKLFKCHINYGAPFSRYQHTFRVWVVSKIGKVWKFPFHFISGISCVIFYQTRVVDHGESNLGFKCSTMCLFRYNDTFEHVRKTSEKSGIPYFLGPWLWSYHIQWKIEGVKRG